MTRNASLFAIALFCCGAASATDVRIRTLPYDPHQIVRVSGHTGIQSTIEFAPDEHIENIAVGDSAAWQVTPNRRATLIFLKPLVATSRSNMTVVTDRRTYMFDLVTSARGALPLYALRFSYPEGEIRPVDALHQPDVSAPAPVTVAAAAPAPVRPEQFNFAWTSKGAASLFPERVFDDGSALYLAWHRDVPLPAIMTMAYDRKEATLNYRVDGEYIIVSPIPSNIVLRYANKQASVWPSANPRPVRSSPAPTLRAVETLASPGGPVVSQPVAPVVLPPQAVALTPAPPSGTAFTEPKMAAASPGKIAYPNDLFNDHVTDAQK